MMPQVLRARGRPRHGMGNRRHNDKMPVATVQCIAGRGVQTADGRVSWLVGGCAARNGETVKRWSAGLLAILMTASPVYGQGQQRPAGAPADRGQEQQRAAPPQGMPGGQERMRQHERMSPEERSQLRRDVSQHGRDVYRQRQDERGPGKGRR